jgi:PAS domain S-box-containing protein
MEKTGRTRSPISILYVEDDPDNRDLFARMIPMKYPDVEFLVAENGRTGLDLFEEHLPDIVITDINMPVMDGVTMSAGIKAIQPDAVIIIVSAYCDANYLLKAIDIGINHYILKPIDYKKLFSTIDKCISGIIMESRLREQNEHLRKLSRAVEQSPSMAMITDVYGNIEYVNPKFTEITGYQADELIGENPRLFKTDMTSAETYRDLWRTISSGHVWRGEFLNRKKNGELYWESASIAPVFDEAGTITHFVAVKEDITSRKRAEEEIEGLNASLAARARQLEEINRRLDAAFRELEAANRKLELSNSELEAFNYTVSHDLKQPLTNINGYCQVILKLFAAQLDRESTLFIRKIHGDTLRMSNLIDSLLAFSRLSNCEMLGARVDLSRIATEIAIELRHTTPQRRIRFVLAEVVTVYGDAGLLRIVMGNIMGNACKYSARKDEAVIEFGVMEYEGKPAYFVRDNGVGFDMGEMDGLFTPFRTLHDRKDFAGYGIGLATVQRIIHRHCGRVWAEGKPGEGAVFFFTLPEQD